MNSNSIFGLMIGGLVSLGLGGLGIYLLFSSLRSKRAAEESLSWPFVVGIVSDAHIKIDGDQERGKFKYYPKVIYAYDVDAKIYDGNKISFGQGPSFSSQQKAEDYLATYKPDAEVNVYYNPKRPSQAVLQQEAIGTKTGLVTGIILVLVTLGSMCGTIYFLRLLR